MKAVTLIFFVKICVCFASLKVYGNEQKREKYIGNPDDFGEFVRPCEVYDLNCIRLFFSKYAKCNIKYGPIPGNLFRSQATINFPRLNTTVDMTNMQSSGFNNTVVLDFYYNKVTNNLVFAIQLRDYAEMSLSSYFKFYRRGREPITGFANTWIFYRALSVTAVFPSIDNLKLDEAEITFYGDDANPSFFINPSFAADADETEVRALVGLLLDEPTDIEELELTKSIYFLAMYIQTNICDFGLKVL